MTLPYLVAQFGMWMIGALVIGLVTGAIAARTRRNARLERSDGWIWLYLLLLAAGIVVAAMRLVLGELGLWLDTLVLFFGLFILGCIVGAVLAGPMRHASGRQPGA